MNESIKTVTIAEAARMLGVDRGTVRKWMTADLLIGKKFPSGRVRLEVSRVQEFFEKLPSTKRESDGN